MNKKRIFALVIILITVAAIWTNPTREQHERVVKEKAEHLIKNQIDHKKQGFLDIGMRLFGNQVVQQFVEKGVVVENYYLFSLTKIKWQGQNNTIGLGAFGKVWISPKIDEKADEIIAIIKNM
ncbi:DUF4359 domain-containing protein [Sphingobacterium faecium]|uniref:DUF4359 domain-containing protein n=1 Tax=Sphingobacterium faecium TaxID=34087 RepID=UPI0024684C80|nr:DUF4359 domain-containing protein [Sphingobacterium faecium]MDH5828448.1 DUF4359 domain-containing protein [Sphingobacterium faecium]